MRSGGSAGSESARPPRAPLGALPNGRARRDRSPEAAAGASKPGRGAASSPQKRRRAGPDPVGREASDAGGAGAAAHPGGDGMIEDLVEQLQRLIGDGAPPGPPLEPPAPRSSWRDRYLANRYRESQRSERQRQRERRIEAEERFRRVFGPARDEGAEVMAKALADAPLVPIVGITPTLRAKLDGWKARYASRDRSAARGGDEGAAPAAS